MMWHYVKAYTLSTFSSKLSVYVRWNGNGVHQAVSLPTLMYAQIKWTNNGCETQTFSKSNHFRLMINWSHTNLKCIYLPSCSCWLPCSFRGARSAAKMIAVRSSMTNNTKAPTKPHRPNKSGGRYCSMCFWHF